MKTQKTLAEMDCREKKQFETLYEMLKKAKLEPEKTNAMKLEETEHSTYYFIKTNKGLLLAEMENDNNFLSYLADAQNGELIHNFLIFNEK